MTRVIYVNGRYLPYAEAGVHAEDRGFQFADSIYEVCEILDGRLIDEGAHMDRLERSLAELRIERPMSRRALGLVMREVIKRNRVRTGLLYLQVSRGAAPRISPSRLGTCLRRSFVSLAVSMMPNARRGPTPASPS